MQHMKLSIFTLLFFLSIYPFVKSQTNLFIPVALSGNSIDLNLQTGTTNFFSGITTNTMGANGNLLGPTIILEQNQSVTMNVQNNLPDTTTIHWHGLHVAPEHDGGPHTEILPGQTWSPSFNVLDKAGTYWYHPHLHMHTDEHVSKGIAGMILVRDAEESGLGLPMQYGIDEFPLVLQTKGFDANGQILVHTNMDSCVLVNGTINASTQFPAQIVRLRILNGSSQRVMQIGFSDNRSFYVIGTDGGLLSMPLSKTRLRLAPGQRADILLDLTNSINQSFELMSFGAELPNAYYGAAQPGMGPGATSSLVGYTSNPLNGANFNLLQINVGNPTSNPVLSIPTSLAVLNPLTQSSAALTRNLTFTSAGAMNNLEGPFLINGTAFNMMQINYTIPINQTEIWSLTNQTPIAHPFHIHDVQFYILDINGVAPPPELSGLNDVVLVPGGMGNVRFIAKFENHANDSIPYMYHCHMLPHEDMGMMGQFLVVDPDASLLENTDATHWHITPNPNNGKFLISGLMQDDSFHLIDASGQWLRQLRTVNQELDLDLQPGVYFLKDNSGGVMKFVVE